MKPKYIRLFFIEKLTYLVKKTGLSFPCRNFWPALCLCVYILIHYMCLCLCVESTDLRVDLFCLNLFLGIVCMRKIALLMFLYIGSCALFCAGMFSFLSLLGLSLFSLPFVFQYAYKFGFSLTFIIVTVVFVAFFLFVSSVVVFFVLWSLLHKNINRIVCTPGPCQTQHEWYKHSMPMKN